MTVIIILVLLVINALFGFFFYRRQQEEKKEIGWNRIKYTIIYAIFGGGLDILAIMVIPMITYHGSIDTELFFYFKVMLLVLLFNKWLTYLLMEDVLFRGIYVKDINYTYIIGTVVILSLLIFSNMINGEFMLDLFKTLFIAIVGIILMMILFGMTSHFKLLFAGGNIEKKEDKDNNNKASDSNRSELIKKEELSWFEKLTNIGEGDFLLVPVFISYLVVLYLLTGNELTLKQIGIMLMLYFFITSVIAVVYYIYLIIKYFIQHKKEIAIPPLYVGLIPAIYITLIIIVITGIFTSNTYLY